MMVGNSSAREARLRLRVCAIAVLALASGPMANPQAPATAAPPPAPQHEANFETERAKANELFLAGQKLEALPLYEDLCRQDQTIAVFAERHAQGLIEKSGTMADGPAKQAAFNQGVAELLRAQKLGDNSPLVQNLLSLVAKSVVGAVVSGVPLTVGYTYQGNSPAQAAMKEGQQLFATHDFDGAVKAYKRAAQLDPAWYEAYLFVGDAYFAMKSYTDSGPWFAKAIAIDPDRDTAYRYWGDALLRNGDPAGAKGEYELAVVAEPYARPAWNSLQQWATVTKTPARLPQIVRPEFTTPDGKLKIDPALTNDSGDGHSSWLVYENARVAHGAAALSQAIVGGAYDKNGQVTPKGYRHSLAEEKESIEAMLADVNARIAAGTVTPEKLEPSLKTLMQLEKDGMLQCWIVLNGSDGGIRYDYPAYRKEHRELLVAYLEKYVLGRQPGAQQ
jgi:tetratricopeptide (TPR) repeat protein